MSQSIRDDRISESTIARIAGNLLSSLSIDEYHVTDMAMAVRQAVTAARAIAAEVRRTASVSVDDEDPRA